MRDRLQRVHVLGLHRVHGVLQRVLPQRVFLPRLPDRLRNM